MMLLGSWVYEDTGRAKTGLFEMWLKSLAKRSTVEDISSRNKLLFERKNATL